MKKVVVFGADGRTGRPVVQELVDKSYEVIASVYVKPKDTIFPEGVTVEVGDVLDSDYVEGVVSNADVVISVVGHIKGGDPRMQTKGAKNIVEAMRKHGVRRILSLTGTGVKQYEDKFSVIDWFLNLLVRKVDPERIKDGIEHAKILEGSGLEWTILRILKLTKGSFRSKSYKLTIGGPVEFSTSRKKVAHILVDLIDKEEWYRKMPVSS